jgi:hypothetical protein
VIVENVAAVISAFAALVIAAGAFLTARANARKADAAKVLAAMEAAKAEEASVVIREQAAAAAAAAAAAKQAALESTAKIVQIGDAVYELGKRVDGRLTELLDAAKALGVSQAQEALAKGIVQGAKAERARDKEQRE